MFKNRLLLWTGVILIGYGLGSVDTVFADDAPMVAGHLVLDAQTPCDGIPVVLEQSANVPFRETRTDWLCQFSFSNLQSGSYYIHVAIPGYQELRQAVHISSPLDVRRLPLVLVKTSRSEGRRGDLTVDVSEMLNAYPKEVRELYKDSVEDRKHEKFKDAAKKLERALGVAPDFYLGHKELGLVYKSLGRLDEAVTHLRRAHELNPREAEPLITLGAVHLERQEYEEAEQALEVAIHTEPRSAPAFFNLGLARFHLKKPGLAEEAFYEALRLEPSLVEVHLALAKVYGESGTMHLAIEQLDRYLDSAPKGAQRTEVERLREQLIQTLGPYPVSGAAQ